MHATLFVALRLWISKLSCTSVPAVAGAMALEPNADAVVCMHTGNGASSVFNILRGPHYHAAHAYAKPHEPATPRYFIHPHTQRPLRLSLLAWQNTKATSASQHHVSLRSANGWARGRSALVSPTVPVHYPFYCTLTSCRATVSSLISYGACLTRPVHILPCEFKAALPASLVHCFRSAHHPVTPCACALCPPRRLPACAAAAAAPAQGSHASAAGRPRPAAGGPPQARCAAGPTP